MVFVLRVLVLGIPTAGGIIRLDVVSPPCHHVYRRVLFFTIGPSFYQA